MKRAEKALRRLKIKAQERQKTTQLLAKLDQVSQELSSARPTLHFVCDYCGIYSAKEARCNKCEREN